LSKNSGNCLFLLLYKCHNKKLVYSVCQTTTFHYSAKVLRLSTILRKSKTLSYLDFVLCSMNRPLVLWWDVERRFCAFQPKPLFQFSFRNILIGKVFNENWNSSSRSKRDPLSIRRAQHLFYQVLLYQLQTSYNNSCYTNFKQVITTFVIPTLRRFCKFKLAMMWLFR
jgi:hypothetical protein